MKMCEHETEILNAVRTGEWTDPLRAHFADCESCAETVMVAEFMRQAAETVPAPAGEAGLVWWKAQLRRRREIADQAVRPILLAERAAAVMVFLGAVWAMAWMSSESSPAAIAGVVALALMTVTAGGVLFYASSRK